MAVQQQPPDPSAVSAAGAAPPSRSRVRKLTIGLVALAVLAAAGHFGWREYEQRMAPKPLADAAPPAAPALPAIADDLRALREQLTRETREREQLQAALDTLRTDLDRDKTALRTAAPDTDTLAVMEVDHLLRLASLAIWEGRSSATLAVLERADALLAPLSDPGIASVRAALIADATALRLAGSVDREGLYLRISALQTAVATLNPTPQPVREPPSDTVPDAPPPVGFWQRLLGNAGAALRHFSAEHLRVRTLEAPPPALLSRAGEARLRQYLELLLSQAQLAALEHEERIYRDALAHATQLLDAHFGFDPRAPALRAELTALQSEPVALTLPDISQSRERVRDWLTHEQQRRSGVTPP